jgi:hypothetical protein
MTQPTQDQAPPLGHCVGCVADQAPAPVPADVLFRGTGLCWQHLRTVLASTGWWAT